MFGDGSLTFREWATREPHPLAVVHDALLEFLRGRDDAVLCGAHAVNAYVDEARMSDDVDLLSMRAKELAEEVRRFLQETFRIRVRTKQAHRRPAYRVYQVKRAGERDLVDVRQVEELPPARRVRKVLVLTPPELVAHKVMAQVRRGRTPSAGIEARDIAILLQTFPALKRENGPVDARLRAAGVDDVVFAAWKDWVAREILPSDEDSKFTYGR